MRDATGRTIQKGDKIIYGTTSGVSCVNAAEVLTDNEPLRARVISTTEFGAKPGREVVLGNVGSRKGFSLHRVIVVESNGSPVDLSQSNVKPLNRKGTF